jgi:RNA polymerase sigma factor (sigma-70 family)
VPTSMSPTSYSILSPHDSAEISADSCVAVRQRISENLERLLDEARPRLLHLAQLNGVPASAADDVVQEVLLEAWRSLEHLREPRRFEAWLDGICRNVSRRHLRAESNNALRIEPLAAGYGESDGAFELADPHAADLDEALSRQDLLALLDRGIGYLPPHSRKALWLHYVAELPCKEAAGHLGVSPGTFDVRLHRARLQLREVLSTQLRAEAESFGLITDEAEIEGWRETRLWCFVCGQRKMRGRFESRPDAGIRFYMRCPDCFERHSAYFMNTRINGPEIPRAFGPAFKRTAREAALYYATAADPAHGQQPCIGCGAPGTAVRIVHADEVPIPTLPGRHYFLTECPFCGLCFSSISVAIWLDPAVQRFVANYSRWISPPEEHTEYAGSPAYHFRLIDLPSAAQLHVFADASTLQVRATFED